MIHLDTSFLVDLLREQNRGDSGPAARMLDLLQGTPLAISVHVVCELFAGAEFSRNPPVEKRRVAQLISEVEIAFPGTEFGPTYGRLFATLSRQGERIALMDLLIATSAVIADAPLVTGNAKDFARVPGLELMSY